MLDLDLDRRIVLVLSAMAAGSLFADEVEAKTVTEEVTSPTTRMTLGHRVLNLERQLYLPRIVNGKFIQGKTEVWNYAVGRLNKIVETAVKKVPKVTEEHTTEQAKKVLQGIHGVLDHTMHGYRKQVTLSKALMGSSLDCDTGSLIYLSVGPLLGLKLSYMEARNHAFLHCSVPKGRDFYWETTTGEVTTRKRIGSKRISIRRGGYLTARSENEVLGISHQIIAGEYMERGDISKAEMETSKALKLIQKSPFVWHLAAINSIMAASKEKDKDKQQALLRQGYKRIRKSLHLDPSNPGALKVYRDFSK